MRIMKELVTVDLSPDYGDVIGAKPVTDDELRIIANKVKPDSMSFEDWAEVLTDENIILVSKSFAEHPDQQLINEIRNVT